MFSGLFDFFNKRRPTPKCVRPRRVRLGIEILEDRIVPASWLWIDSTGDGLATTAHNWFNTTGHYGVPSSGDYMNFSPNAQNFPYGPLGSNANCTFNANMSVDRIDVTNGASGYTGILTVNSGITVSCVTEFVQYSTLTLYSSAAVDVTGGNLYLNGTVNTYAAPSTPATITVQGDIIQYGTVTVFPGALAISSNGYTDDGAITVGNSTGGSSTLSITGLFTEDSGKTIGVLSGSTLDFIDTSGSSDYPDIQGTITLSGTLISGNELHIDSGGTLISGAGTNTLSGDVADGGNLTIGTGAGSASVLGDTSGSMTVDGTLTLNAGSTLGFAPAASSTFVVTSSGTVNMNGALIVMNTTRISTMQINGTLDSAGNSFGGGDAIDGNVTNDGTVEFTGALHTLAIATSGGSGGSYTQNSDGTLSMELNNGSGGAGISDILAVAASATLDGTLTLTELASLSSPQNWTLITTGTGISGDFAAFSFPDSNPAWNAGVFGADYEASN